MGALVPLMLPLLGATGGAGLYLVWQALGASAGRPPRRRRRPRGPRGPRWPRRPSWPRWRSGEVGGGGAASSPALLRERHLGARLGGAAAAGLVAWVVTGWPVGFLLGGMAVLGAEGLGQGASRTVVARLEAIAAWTEMLRDTLAGAAGLTQAILTTSEVAPAAIAVEVAELASRVAAGVGLPGALASFGEALADPAADMVVAALVMASTERSQRLGELLGGLAATTREEVVLRLDVEASRASARTAVRTVTGFSVGLLLLLAVAARGYLGPYRSVAGQLVLVLVGCIFAVGLWLMAAMVRPKRFPRLRLTPRPA